MGGKRVFGDLKTAPGGLLKTEGLLCFFADFLAFVGVLKKDTEKTTRLFHIHLTFFIRKTII